MGGVRACCERVFSPIFTDFRIFLLQILQFLAKFGKNWHFFGLIFRDPWAIFQILTQNLEKHWIRAPFSRPGSAFFGFLAFFSSIWPYFRRFSSNLGRFRLSFLLSRSISCKIPPKHETLLFCKAFTPHPNMTTLQYSPVTTFSTRQSLKVAPERSRLGHEVD